MTCPFCDARVIEKQTIHETAFCYVFYNIRESNKGRCLVVPKRHVENVRNLTQEEVADVFRTLQIVSKKIHEHVRPIAINYGWNEGSYAGQMVQHFHVHIMPRVDGDSLPKHHLFHSAVKKNHPEDELRELVKEFRSLF